MPDLSRQTFRVVAAPRYQKCSCGCGQNIQKGEMVFARPSLLGLRRTGENRIIDLEDHYHAWVESVVHQLATAKASKDSEFSRYLGGRR